MSTFFSSLYFLSNLLRILILRIHKTLYDILALTVPSRLPMPVCLPIIRGVKIKGSTSSLGFLHSSDSRPGMEVHVSLDDQAILEQLPYVLA